MSRLTRNISNLPDYYFKLNGKQKRNWRRNTRKIERNEELRSQFPPYNPSADINIIHLHHQTEITTINQLIQQAKTTKRYTIDTESQKRQSENHGALIQIEMVHSINHSTVILLEVYHLPDVDSLLFGRIQELWSIIFNSDNEIITWGPIAKEFENFQHLEWIKIGKTQKINLQYFFQGWHDGTLTHPETERRVAITSVPMDTPGDDDYSDEEELITSYNEQAIEWSLQSAVATALNKFLDKSQTLNYWNCGLDLTLNTWRSKLFSNKYYDMDLEKRTRMELINYAVHDCTSVTEIYFIMYPQQRNRKNNEKKPAATSRTINKTPRTTPAAIPDHQELYLDVSDDEIQIYVPKFNQTRVINQPDNQPVEIIISTTQEEMNDIDFEQQPSESTPTPATASKTVKTINNYLGNLSDISDDELVDILKPKFNQRTTTTTTQQSKTEKQRKKNLKLKLKQRYHPNFQRKMKRPIYYRYDVHKVRSQLADDEVYTSHQVKIDYQKLNVTIGFKSDEQENRAKSIVKINYFSREQYHKRWGEKEKKKNN